MGGDAKAAELKGDRPKKTNSEAFADALAQAKKDALRGGLPGMLAMAIQVLSLMWLRTAVNYQYRHGGLSMMHALKTLYKEGGVRRLYAGVGVALVQAPMSRFGDTAANAGMLSLMNGLDATRELPTAFKTVCASAGAGSFRVLLMPVDAVKTSLQVDGAAGFGILTAKIRKHGPLVLFRGAIAASSATFIGHYPWFATYNYLDANLPKSNDLKEKLLRAAFMGWCSSFVSDCCSNSVRVVKTVRQTSPETLSYSQVVKQVVEKDGVIGLFGRGLTTKLVTNGIQGIMFSVLWRLGQDYYTKIQDKK